MALCVVVNSLGQVVQSTVQPEQPATCSYVLVSGAEYGAFVNPTWEALGITPGAVTQVMLWGFGAILSAWVMGLVGGWAAQAVKNAG